MSNTDTYLLQIAALKNHIENLVVMHHGELTAERRKTEKAVQDLTVAQWALCGLCGTRARIAHSVDDRLTAAAAADLAIITDNLGRNTAAHFLREAHLQFMEHARFNAARRRIAYLESQCRVNGVGFAPWVDEVRDTDWPTAKLVGPWSKI